MKSRTLCLLLALCLLLGLLSGCGDDETPPQPLYADRADAKRGELTGVSKADSAEAVRDCLTQAGQMNTEGREAATHADDRTPGKELRLAAPETALVQTDGAYIYMLDSYGLVIVSAAGKDSRILSYSRVAVDANVTQRRLFVRGDRAAVLCGMQDFSYDADGELLQGGKTELILLDISDRSAPKELTRTVVDGTLTAADFTGDALCLVTRHSFWNLPEPEQTEALLPWFSEAGQKTALRPSDLYLCEEPAQAAVTVVTTLRPEDGRVLDALAFLGGADAVLLAQNAIYLGRTRWHEQKTEPNRDEKPYVVVGYTQTAQTELIRLVCDPDGGLSLDGGCTQAGALLDEAALSLQGTTLCAALQVNECVFNAFTDEAHGWTNYELVSEERHSRIVLMDATLRAENGVMLDNIGGAHGVLACRFLENLAFLTTEKPADPVYCADLSTPDAPAMGGSLVLPGTSARFYALKDGMVLVLSETTETNGLTLSVFNGAAADRMERTDRETVRQSSQALRNPNALFTDAQTGLIGLPLEGEHAAYLLLECDGGNLKEKGTLALEYVPDDARTLLIDGLLYICGPGEVYVADPEEAELLAVVSNAVG